MAPKGQKGPSGKQKQSEEEREDPLQAVVLADTFETRFLPFSLERPRCLLPLANTPLIEYTLEFLANAGVGEVFLYGGAHTDQVEEYINASKWRLPTSPFKKFIILKSTSMSVGDVMRDLDAKAFITGDFICVSGDIVSNYPIQTVLAKHRARRKKDPNAIMTMVLREAGSEHKTKAQITSPVFVIDPTTHRCIHYEEMTLNQEDAYLNLDPEFLKYHFEIDIRQDLIDCNIDICTPEVLSLWSDSFDYQSPRKHFLYGVLKDHELNGKIIHTHIIRRHYAARAQSLNAYDSISKDIVSRWTYPLCPDTNLLPGHHYVFRKGNIYQESGVNMARSCAVHRRTVIGQGTSIGDRTTIGNSIVGRRCQIGKNVNIEGAYIWDDAVIGDGSEIRQAIIANEAFVGKGCIIEPGALISFGVRFAEGTIVSGTSRITKAMREGDTHVRNDKDIVGQGGEGYLLMEDADNDETDDGSALSSKLIYNMADLVLSDASISTLTSEVSDEIPEYRGSRSGSFATTLSEDDDGKQFHYVASKGIADALELDQGPDVVQLELTGLRLSENASEHQVRHAVITAFMRRIQILIESGSVGASEAVKKVFTDYKAVVERTIFDKEKDQKLDQVDLLLLIQKELVHRNKGDTILLFTAKELYDLEVVEEEAIEEWWADERSSNDDEMRQVRKQTEQFVEWLASAEEDNSEEDESGAFKTPPQSKKRKASECIEDASLVSKALKKAAPSGRSASIAPATPLTEIGTPAAMDTDDEFMSGTGSEEEDFGGTQESDDGSFEDFDDDQDMGFSPDKDIIKSTKNSFEVDFKVLSPQDIQASQNEQIDEVSLILDLPPEFSAILLRYTRWNKEKLVASYIDNPESLLESAGLGPESTGSRKIMVLDGFMCDICCDDEEGLETYAMICGHRYCVDCYRHYLGQKIKEEGEAARIECPSEVCHRIVDSKSLDLLVTEDLADRYHLLLIRTFVDDKETLKWCPAPNCEFAVECGVRKKDLPRVVPTVHCQCKHNFCFGCSLNDHLPAPCALVKKWLKKCEDDSETANWISANTKECPKCQSTIEKNGGCNHMTCRKCKHEFCWMCMGLWSEHGTSWYNCNRFEEKSGSDARDAQAKSRQSLERYLHYYNRYANHEQSAKLDKDLYLKTEKKMTSLQSQSGMSWIEVQFLETASVALQQCRQTLKWTYAFAYYLERNNLTEIFEDNQKDLEMAVEDLSAMFEKPIPELKDLKVPILDKTAYCDRRRIVLLNDTAERLKTEGWKFNVEV